MATKVLFVLHMPPPVHGAALMGKYIHDSEIINGLFEAHYVNLALSDNLAEIGKANIKKIWLFIKKMANIIAVIEKEKPALCYITPNATGAAFYKDFLIVMLLKTMRQKVIVHYHNKGIASRQKYFFDNMLYRLFFHKIKVILLADILYEDIKMYVNASDVYICPNGIPLTKIEKIPDTAFCKETVNLLFLSNMMSEKGVWDLLEACRILKEKGKAFCCDFVGKWSDITPHIFETKVKEYKLDTFVKAHGEKYGDGKKEFLQKADIFVFPTYYHNECFPLVLLEAMEYELPCISTHEGGISDIIDNAYTGYVVEKQNPQEVVDKILFLIEHPEIRKEMGRNARMKFVDKYTLEVFETRMGEILGKEIL